MEECELEHSSRENSFVTVIISDREVRCSGVLHNVHVSPATIRLATREEARQQYAKELIKFFVGGLKLRLPAKTPAAAGIERRWLQQAAAAQQRMRGDNPLTNVTLATPPLLPAPPPPPAAQTPAEDNSPDKYSKPGKRRLL